jgi:hypothetical protein
VNSAAELGENFENLAWIQVMPFMISANKKPRPKTTPYPTPGGRGGVLGDKDMVVGQEQMRPLLSLKCPCNA